MRYLLKDYTGIGRKNGAAAHFLRSIGPTLLRFNVSFRSNFVALKMVKFLPGKVKNR
jgi:hypothetical protein